MQTLAYVLFVLVIVCIFQIYCNGIVITNNRVKKLKLVGRNSLNSYPTTTTFEIPDQINVIIYDLANEETLYHTQNITDEYERDHDDAELKKISKELQTDSNPIYKHVPELTHSIGNTIAFCKSQNDKYVSLAYVRV